MTFWSTEVGDPTMAVILSPRLSKSIRRYSMYIWAERTTLFVGIVCTFEQTGPQDLRYLVPVPVPGNIHERPNERKGFSTAAKASGPVRSLFDPGRLTTKPPSSSPTFRQLYRPCIRFRSHGSTAVYSILTHTDHRKIYVNVNIYRPVGNVLLVGIHIFRVSQLWMPLFHRICT